jgi:hypothetical protein
MRAPASFTNGSSHQNQFRVVSVITLVCGQYARVILGSSGSRSPFFTHTLIDGALVGMRTGAIELLGQVAMTQ